MDSTIYEIQTEDFYTDKAPDVDEWFDRSNYPSMIDRPLPTGRNKKALGKMKDEAAGSIITEFVDLRSKSYSWETLESSTRCTKGVKRHVIRGMTHADFERSLLEGEKIYRMADYKGQY